ncbi:MAG: hypothetical protein AB7Q42_05975 [Acidimicrobiia bacterium]
MTIRLAVTRRGVRLVPVESFDVDRSWWLLLVRMYRMHRDTAAQSDLRSMVFLALKAGQS